MCPKTKGVIFCWSIVLIFSSLVLYICDIGNKKCHIVSLMMIQNHIWQQELTQGLKNQYWWSHQCRSGWNESPNFCRRLKITPLFFGQPVENYIGDRFIIFKNYIFCYTFSVGHIEIKLYCPKNFLLTFEMGHFFLRHPLHVILKCTFRATGTPCKCDMLDLCCFCVHLHLCHYNENIKYCL